MTGLRAPVATVGALVVAAAVTVTAGGCSDSHPDETQIRKVVDRFAVAVDREDQAAIIALMCAQEAADITDDDDYDPANDGGLATAPPPLAVHTSDVRVTGSVASARVERPGQPSTTLWFRKERGRWTVCAYARDDATAAPTPTRTT